MCSLRVLYEHTYCPHRYSSEVILNIDCLLYILLNIALLSCLSPQSTNIRPTIPFHFVRWIAVNERFKGYVPFMDNLCLSLLSSDPRLFASLGSLYSCAPLIDPSSFHSPRLPWLHPLYPALTWVCLIQYRYNSERFGRSFSYIN